MDNDYDPVSVASALAQVARIYGPRGATALALALGRVVALLGLPLADALSTVRLAHGASRG